MKTVLKKHPLAIRWFHWINFPVLATMIWSGLLIYWAYDPYKINVANKELFHFFPKSFYSALNIPFHLAEGMSFHFAFAWLFIINGLLYIFYTIFSGEWRYLLPNRKSFKEAWQVLLYDLHIRKFHPPQDKYNAAQRIAYTAIIIMGIGSVITGFAIYKPTQLNWITAICGGYEAARMEHFILTIGYVLFFLIHIAQVIKTGWHNFQAMITGIEVIPNATYPNVPIQNNPDEKHDFFNRTAVESDQKIRRRTFFSFLTFAIAGASGIAGWKWLNRQPRADGTLQPLRNTLETNEKVLTSTFSEHRLVKTYPKSAAVANVRVNSLLGTRENVDANTWRLNVQKSDGSTALFSLDDIKKLPKKDLVYDFKCVEGWSQIQYWSGVALKDFIAANGLQERTKMKYIGLQTPDKKYYVGLDMQSALHPQTMLCYEMNGQPLTQQHGYPLRLIIPVKYGIKNLKCIGTMYFSNQKPPDYWAERGYDYYAGL